MGRSLKYGHRVPYEAFYVPVAAREDQDAALQLGVEWAMTSRYDGLRGMAINSWSTVQSRRVLLDARPDFALLALIQHNPLAIEDFGPVLAVWPASKTLAKAVNYADGAELCVIVSSRYDVSDWIEESGAVELTSEVLADRLPRRRSGGRR